MLDFLFQRNLPTLKVSIVSFPFSVYFSVASFGYVLKAGFYEFPVFLYCGCDFHCELVVVGCSEDSAFEVDVYFRVFDALLIELYYPKLAYKLLYKIVIEQFSNCIYVQLFNCSTEIQFPFFKLETTYMLTILQYRDKLRYFNRNRKNKKKKEEKSPFSLSALF